MNYVHTGTGAVVTISALRKQLNISIPDDADLTAFGYATLIETSRPAITAFQTLAEGPITDNARTWIVTDLPLADCLAITLAEADRIAAAKRDMVVSGVSPAEMASWSIKRAEAIACQASGLAADAPNLGIEAMARGVTLSDLVGKVLNKSAMLSALEAGIAGRCGAIQDAAMAATSVADLLLIDTEAGWPV